MCVNKDIPYLNAYGTMRSSREELILGVVGHAHYKNKYMVFYCY
jgi:hypothetical protein